MNKLLTYINAFIELFYPELCVACGVNLITHEKVLCSKCIYELPRTYFHKVPGNPMEQAFWGRVDIHKAAALFFFVNKSRFRHLIHLLKYNNRKDIGIELGRLYGNELISEADFKTIDYVIPVPLHYKKLQKRGYNQSEMIAKGLTKVLPADLRTDFLYRKKFTETQTKKLRYERWENVNNVFGIKNGNNLNNKHILLVDDVMTTGSTIEGCANALLSTAENIKISIVTLAFAHY
jgi:ComF family protein